MIASLLLGCLSKGPDAPNCSTTTFYSDADSDGFGDASDTVVACAAPKQYTSLAGDCHDGNASISPLAEEEPYDAFDNDCDASTPDDDLDGDSAPADRDCDDADPTVADHLPEVCDEKDNDCDGLVDDADGVVYFDADDRWWQDQDGDTLGDPATWEDRCVGRAGFVRNDDDCDDTDESLPAAWVMDIDGDGFGAGPTVALACVAPDPDAVLAEGLADCDDTEFATSPDADDACGDGDDTNCDGMDAWCHVPPWGEFRLERAEVRIASSVTGANFGASIAALGDTDLDGFGDFIVGGSGLDAAAGVGSTRQYQGWLYGILDADAASDGALSGISNGDHFGSTIASAGDVTGDGSTWIIGGAPDRNGAANDAGAAFVLASGAGLALADAIAITGGVLDGHAGSAVAGLGDLDGNGLDDVGVGASHGALFDAGQVGAFLAPLADVGMASADLLITGTGSYGHLGTALVPMADLDGDGVPDVAVGGSGGDGRVSVFQGVTRGSVEDTDAALVIAGAPGSGAGAALAGSTDVTGDGTADLLIGAPDDDSGGTSAGTLFVVHGGTGATEVDLADGADAELYGLPGDGLGTSVTGLGDFDGDGQGDFAVGAPNNDDNGLDAGAAWLVTAGGFGLGSIEDIARAVLIGEFAGAQAGASVADVGDVDHDGLSDLGVGAPGDATFATNGGAIYVLFGAD